MFARSGRLAAVGAALCAAAFVFGDSTVTSQDQRLAALEMRLAALQAREQAGSAEMAGVIDSVLRDADRRSQLLADSGDASAGYDNGFFIRGGGWTLRPGGQFQFRHVTSYREDPADGDETDDGFEVRRMRLDLGGSALTRDLTFFFQWETQRSGGSLDLLEAWTRYMFSPDWGARIGQFKTPVTHEYVMSSKRQLAADTSLMDCLVGGGITNYTQAVTLIHGGYGKDKPLYVEAGFHDGANQPNTDFTGRTDTATFTGAPPRHGFDFGLAGRAEYKLFGDWTSYTDFTAKGTKSPMLVAGAGGDWSQGGDGDQLIGTVDAQYELPAGLGFYTAATVRYLDSALSGRAEDTTDWGLLAQVAYLVQPQWELFARYDVTFLDQSATFAAGAEDVFQEITVGMNYYLGVNGSALHRAKFTLDLTWLPDSAPRAVSGLGILDANDGQDEIILRGQFQLVL